MMQLPGIELTSDYSKASALRLSQKVWYSMDKATIRREFEHERIKLAENGKRNHLSNRSL